MYDPKGNGKDRAVQSVQFVEAEPPAHLSGIVHRFLELKTDGTLADDYRFHALPDACTYLVFDQSDALISGVTKLRASSEELNLGRAFHYINIRFLPGVWQVDREPVSYGMLDVPYMGDLPLIELNRKLSNRDLTANQPLLSELVEQLIDSKHVIANPVTEKIFRHFDEIHTVADMASISDLSPRQLQRVLKKTTGFAPHDFLKVLRLQQSLLGEPSLSYADQSHFIHSFRKATGYTPAKYSQKFDV
ncbi:MAG: AraC family transcriptional regulator [Roseibium sp.]